MPDRRSEHGIPLSTTQTAPAPARSRARHSQATHLVRSTLAFTAAPRRLGRRDLMIISPHHDEFIIRMAAKKCALLQEKSDGDDLIKPFTCSAPGCAAAAGSPAASVGFIQGPRAD